MKIAIASDDKKIISHHFGRALGFMIFELNDEKVMNREYRENRGKNKGKCGTCDHTIMINNIQFKQKT